MLNRRFSQKIAIFILPLLLIIGCAGSRRDKTIESTFHALNAAKEGFLVWDESHQSSIVKRAVTFEDGRRDLFVYWEKRDKVVVAFEAGYKAIAFAALDKSEKNVEEAVNRVKEVFELIKTLAEGE